MWDVVTPCSLVDIDQRFVCICVLFYLMTLSQYVRLYSVL
jgi:hypothetical protein